MITLVGCGDAFINRCVSDTPYEGFNSVAELLHSHDVRFCNLETTVHNNEGYPSLFPGGGWAMANPAVLDTLKRYGFNALSVANNHTMDYCHRGLEATLRHLDEADLAHAGAGMNLHEAAAPTYIECPGGRVALIAATSSFHDSDAAGNQGYAVPGRPGVNPLRHKAVYQVTPDLYEKVIEIGNATGMNDTLNWSAANGYREAPATAALRSLVFAPGDENKKTAHPDEADMKRIEASIKEATALADCVVVSMHSHQFKGTDEVPDDFIVEFCHNCIDAGAHVVFGTGSHILRGIEVYNDGVIFYGLGDFVLQHESMPALPADFYEKHAADEPELWNSVGQAMLKRSAGGTKGLCANPKAWQSIAASIQFDGGVKQVQIHPIDLGFDDQTSLKGWPKLDGGHAILEEMQRLSQPYGTQISILGNVGTIAL